MIFGFLSDLTSLSMIISNDTNGTYLQHRSRLTGLENELMVSSGGESGEGTESEGVWEGTHYCI